MADKKSDGGKSNESPDQKYGPKIANLIHELAAAIAKESGASGVRVVCDFDFKIDPKFPTGRGNISMKTFTTPDAKTERMLDPKVQMPRGSKLQHDAEKALGRAFLAMRKKGGWEA